MSDVAANRQLESLRQNGQNHLRLLQRIRAENEDNRRAKDWSEKAANANRFHLLIEAVRRVVGPELLPYTDLEALEESLNAQTKSAGVMLTLPDSARIAMLFFWLEPEWKWQQVPLGLLYDAQGPELFLVECFHACSQGVHALPYALWHRTTEWPIAVARAQENYREKLKLLSERKAEQFQPASPSDRLRAAVHQAAHQVLQKLVEEIRLG